jgi:ATP-dependent Clp protease ATP-binding subunit ClpA
VGTEHLLLGLLDRPDGVATITLKRLGVMPDDLRDRLLGKLRPPEPRLDGDALATLGIDLDRVRARVQEAFGPGSLELGPTACMGIAPGAKRALQAAVEEAGGGPVRDDHILIGLVSVEDSLAARVLTELGVGRGQLAG